MEYVKDLQFVIQDIGPLISSLKNSYKKETNPKVKLIDSFIFFCVLVFLGCVAYKFIMPGAPLNSFLAAAFLSMGEAALGMSLRLQITDDEFRKDSKAGAFIHFLVASVLMCSVALWYMP